MDWPLFQTVVAHYNALPVSKVQTNAMRLTSLGYRASCCDRNNEHCSRKPLHLAGEPSYFSGKARRGLLVVEAGVTDAVGGVVDGGLASAGGVCMLCSVLTSSSVIKVR